MGSVNQVVHDAYAQGFRSMGVDVKEILMMDIRSTSSVDKDALLWRMVDRIEAGMVVMHCIDSMAPHLPAWAVWCYAPRIDEYLVEQGVLFSWLLTQVNGRLKSGKKRYREATEQKIRDVVAYTVMDYRSYVNTGGREYPVRRIIKECRILQNNWHRDFEPWHSHAWELCHQLDQALFSVLDPLMKRIRGEDVSEVR